jgi:hypothetical protein
MNRLEQLFRDRIILLGRSKDKGMAAKISKLSLGPPKPNVFRTPPVPSVFTSKETNGSSTQIPQDMIIRSMREMRSRVEICVRRQRRTLGGASNELTKYLSLFRRENGWLRNPRRVQWTWKCFYSVEISDLCGYTFYSDTLGEVKFQC